MDSEPYGCGVGIHAQLQYMYHGALYNMRDEVTILSLIDMNA